MSKQELIDSFNKEKKYYRRIYYFDKKGRRCTGYALKWWAVPIKRLRGDKTMTVSQFHKDVEKQARGY